MIPISLYFVAFFTLMCVFLYTEWRVWLTFEHDFQYLKNLVQDAGLRIGVTDSHEIAIYLDFIESEQGIIFEKYNDSCHRPIPYNVLIVSSNICIVGLILSLISLFS